MQRTIDPLFNDHLPRQNSFPDLVKLAVVSNGVVVSHRAVGSDAQGLIQIETTRRFDMNIGLVGRNHSELPVVGP